MFFDSEAISWLRERGLATFRGGRQRKANAKRADIVMRGEADAIMQADAVIAVSAAEVRNTHLLLAEAGRKSSDLRAFVVSNPMPTPRPPSPLSDKSRADRSGILFVGPFHTGKDRNLNNGDAVLWFVREVLPLVRRRLGPSHSPVTIVGSNPPGDVHNLTMLAPNISVLGFVPDLGAVFRAARVFVAPNPYAAGTLSLEFWEPGAVLFLVHCEPS